MENPQPSTRGVVKDNFRKRNCGLQMSDTSRRGQISSVNRKRNIKPLRVASRKPNCFEVNFLSRCVAGDGDGNQVFHRLHQVTTCRL